MLDIFFTRLKHKCQHLTENVLDKFYMDLKNMVCEVLSWVNKHKKSL